MALFKKAHADIALVADVESGARDAGASLTVGAPPEAESAADAAAPHQTIPPPGEPALAVQLAAPAAGDELLLQMFKSVGGTESQGNSSLLALVGDVAIDDLVSELGIVAAALGVSSGPLSATWDVAA